jgi:hypothetical protein
LALAAAPLHEQWRDESDPPAKPPPRCSGTLNKIRRIDVARQEQAPYHQRLY